jgi:nitrogen fixation/metabolism regulation signal transduction histidine kinase
MESRIFFWNVILRVGLLIITTFVFVWILESLENEWIFSLLTGAVVITLQIVLLTRYVLRLSRVLEQFIESIGNEEIPEIQFRTSRILFKGLKERSNIIKQGMNERRLEKEKYNQILNHVINSADIGLFCFRQNDKLLFINEVARSLISGRDITHMDEIKPLNEKLWRSLNGLKPGIPSVFRIGPGREPRDKFGGEQLFSIRLKAVTVFEEKYRLFSVHNIQEELHKNESDSWQKIIRVLTHEIMNAVAPMLSLTKSMQNRLTGKKDEELGKVLEALKVIEKTGEGLIDFTEEYRRLSLLPPPKKEMLNVEDTLAGIQVLVEGEASEKDIWISLKCKEPEASIFADKQQFEMVMLNLLKNSFDALTGRQHDRSVVISVQKSEGRVLLKLEDNGSGIPENLTDQVFVPFFSTKEEGSGIGLSLVRQIMNNHGGSVLLESIQGKKTVVTLSFPDKD